jgi:outer membrane protein OmpA-like peptidoglycan-associated protein
MITRNALRAVALASSCLAPLAAFAQAPASAGSQAPVIAIGGTPFSGEVGFGVMGVMGQNADQAGRYNGLNTTGVDVLGNFDLIGRDPWNSGGTRYYDFYGDNLVFQTGNNFGSDVGTDSAFGSSVSNGLINEGRIGFGVGDQGTWGVNGFYQAITYTGNPIESMYTVNGNQGFLNPGLRTFGGAASQTTATAGVLTNTPAITGPQLAATGGFLPVQTGTRRDIVGGNFKYIWGGWTVTGAFQHEHKEGSLEESFTGPWAGTAFALPVDYDTDRYDATAAYNSRLYQGVIQYTFSHFSDNNLFVSLPYPYANTKSPYQPQAAYSTPPSNSAQYVTLMLATNAIPETRINLNARVGVEKQDDTFPPNTADPGLTPALLAGAGLNSAAQGTTQDSPDITATVYQLRVSANNHSLPRTDIDAYYGVDGRSVNLNQYKVNTIGSPGGETADTGLAPTYTFVVPQDWLKQNAGAEATYNLIPAYSTKLSLGYRLDITDRSNAQVGHSSTNTGSVAVMSNLGPQLNGRLSFDYIGRTGNLSYLTPFENLADAPSGQTYSGAYYQAPMTSEAATLRVDYQPMDNLGANFFAQFKNENYTYPAATPVGTATALTVPITGVGAGIKQDYALTVGPDITYRPMKNLDLHLFYTYELLMFNNLGNGECSDLANINVAANGCTGTVGYFQNKDTSSTHTVGASGEWKVNEKLKLKADYTVSYGSVMFTEFNGVFVAKPTQSYQNVTNYPDIDALMNSLSLMASYQLTSSMELILQGVYSSYHNTDWRDDPSAIQGAGTTAISTLSTGTAQPNWSIGTVMAGMRIKFGEGPPLLPPVTMVTPAAAVQPARSYLVFFDWDKATLTDRARQIIKDAATNSTHVQHTRIEVNGYTDTSGAPQYNMGLSIRRADAVKAELMKDGVPESDIATKGFGETHPLVPTGPGVREPQNRRVEIVIL